MDLRSTAIQYYEKYILTLLSTVSVIKDDTMNCLNSLIRFQSPRSIVNSHAVLSALFEEIVSEGSEHQLGIVSTVNVETLIKDISTSHMGMESFAEESAAIISLLFAAWCSYQYVYNAKLSKIQGIGEYSLVKRTVRSAMFIFVSIFFRNVENAI